MTGTAHAPTELRSDAFKLHRLMTGYLGASALFSAVELGVFEALEAAGPCTAEQLGERVGLAGRPARILLLALEGEELLERTPEGYVNAPVTKAFLVSDSPTYVGSLASHQSRHFPKFARLTEALKQNGPIQLGPNYQFAFGDDRQWARRMAEVTRASETLMAEDLTAKAPLDGHRHLVDLGCASCAYSMAFARANPHLRVTGVDQAPVHEVGQEFVAAAGMSDRVTVVPGDIFVDSFEDGDAALLSHTLQGFDRQRASALLRHVGSWLPPGGELLLQVHLPERGEVPFPYQFGLILMINNTLGGEAHSEETILGWLRDAGFGEPELTPTSPISTLIRARK